MTSVPDLVRISRLETQFYSNPECIQHVKYESTISTNQRSVRKEEKWIKERRLGRGNFGIVWLEQCIQGDTKGEKRAVKQVQKLQASDYYRELEAIALFSHTRVGLLLLNTLFSLLGANLDLVRALLCQIFWLVRRR